VTTEITEPILQLSKHESETKNMSLKKERKKKQANLGNPPKPGLISKIHNS